MLYQPVDELVTRSAAGRILDGRADGGAVRREVASLVSRISLLVAEADILAVDVNPVVVLPGGIAIVDAKIVTQHPGSPRTTVGHSGADEGADS